MDISETLAPNSDQLDAIELLGAPRTFTIREVTRGTVEQPVNIFLHDFPRPWRPGKSMRRVLVACWGTDASQYAGRRVTLYCDPEVVFGKEKVGGTRIKALSHIDGPKRVSLLVSRGRSAPYVVEPLADARDALADAVTRARHARTKTELRPLYKAAADLGMDTTIAAELRDLAAALPDTDEVTE